MDANQVYDRTTMAIKDELKIGRPHGPNTSENVVPGCESHNEQCDSDDEAMETNDDVDDVENADATIPDEDQTDAGEEEPVMYECPAPGCNHQFKHERDVKKHLVLGRHTRNPDSETMMDALAHAYLTEVEKVQSTNSETAAIAETVYAEPTSEPLTEGYAIRKQAVPVKITPRVRTLLEQMFDDGVANNRKMTPAEAVAIIMTKKQPNGQLYYHREERLETQHVARVWSSIKLRRERAPTIGRRTDGRTRVATVSAEGTGDTEMLADEHGVHVSL